MAHYKMILSGEVIDVGNRFVYWVPENRILAYCDANHAEMIQSAIDDGKLYHTEWLRRIPHGAPECTEVELKRIEESEFDELKALLGDGERVEEVREPGPEPEPELEPETPPEEQEKPMTVQQMRDKIAELENMLAQIIGKIQ